MCTLRSVTRDLEEKDWNAASEKGRGKGGRDLLKPWRVTTRLQSLQAILNPSPGKKVWFREEKKLKKRESKKRAGANGRQKDTKTRRRTSIQERTQEGKWLTF